MGVHTGRFAVIDGVPAVANWQINDGGGVAPFVNSATKDGTGTVRAIEAWNGGYLAHDGAPSVIPGQFITFSGYTAPDNDTLNGVGTVYSGTAIIDSLTLAWDFAGGAVMAHQVGFSGHLALTQTDADAAILDAAVSNPASVCVCKIESSVDGVTWVEQDNVVSAQLTMQRANVAYVNSSTGCLTGRKQGVFNWNASINVDNNKLYNGLTKYGYYYWRFWVSADEYYELKWGQVQEATGLTLQPQTDAIIAHTINITMSGVNAGVMGHVKFVQPSSELEIW